MSDKTYILKQPVKAKNLKNDWTYVEYFIREESYDADRVATDWFENIFKEFSVDAIRKQITEILNNSFGDSTHFIESNNLCVDRILEVTLGRKQ